jgi:hypothetical protein
MKRAVFKSIFISLAFTSLAFAQSTAPAALKESNAAKAQPQASQKTKSENPAAAKQPGSSQAAGNQTSGRNKVGSVAAAPNVSPSVKLNELLKLNDLNVEVLFTVVTPPDNGSNNNGNLIGTFGTINVRAEYSNGQVATALVGIKKGDRRSRITLTPFTPGGVGNGGGNAGAPPPLKDEKLGVPTGSAAGSPAGSVGGLNKEKGVLISNTGNAPPRLIRAEVQLSVNVKQGDKNVSLTDSLSRKF